jgi:hypothetical protein
MKDLMEPPDKRDSVEAKLAGAVSGFGVDYRRIGSPDCTGGHNGERVASQKTHSAGKWEKNPQGFNFLMGCVLRMRHAMSMAGRPGRA